METKLGLKSELGNTDLNHPLMSRWKLHHVSLITLLDLTRPDQTRLGDRANKLLITSNKNRAPQWDFLTKTLMVSLLQLSIEANSTDLVPLTSKQPMEWNGMECVKLTKHLIRTWVPPVCTKSKSLEYHIPD